ncbi:putative GNAT family acetyltransferase [Neisseria sp. HSC-16F19]|nr:GNAT family N-acetyltransferase [Neisseria sp. HSC-16F19]MCP2041558.1 putative GNAT family acetyltransferase [Neisseria sp. HSC-16F19]
MQHNYTVTDNTEKSRFEIHVDGHIAFEDYRLFDGGIAYVHTEVPPELGGRGIASFLIKYILDDAIAKGLKIKPVCPFVRAYIEKHPEYQAHTVAA